MFCKSGSIQSESYLFCAERDGSFRVYSYLRCSFSLLFRVLCIKQRLFYGPSFHITVAVEVQYLTPSVPQREVAWPDNHSPGQGPLWPVLLLSRPCLTLSCLCLGDQPSGEAPGRGPGPPAIRVGRPCGQWARPLPRGSSPRPHAPARLPSRQPCQGQQQ